MRTRTGKVKVGGQRVLHMGVCSILQWLDHPRLGVRNMFFCAFTGLGAAQRQKPTTLRIDSYFGRCSLPSHVKGHVLSVYDLLVNYW